MNKTLISFKALLIASLKMYVRNRGAVIFSLIIPLALLGVFGLLSKGGQASVKLDLVNKSTTELSKKFVEGVKAVPAFKITETDEQKSSEDLRNGDVDLEVIVPEDFGKVSETGQIQPGAVITHYNQAKPGNGQTANLVLSQITAGINNALTQAPQIITVQSSGVKTSNLGFFDFILPGILAMVIMQTGLFSVAFAFVSMKASGALRRVQATPIQPRVFILAQTVTRLLVTLATVMILIAFGIKFFNFHMLGSYWTFALVVILGSLIFLGFGFAVAGVSKDENQAAPLANVIQLPMLLLSGIFFPRDSFPAWLKTITDYFPLTFLGEAMRRIANEGAHLAQLGPQLLGLAIWCLVVFVISVKFFRWE